MTTEKILLDHGSGGKISNRMITETILPIFNNPLLAQLNDGAVFDLNGTRLAFTTDSYVVDPIFFPGGNIGDLAVNGTINDLAMCGAEPLYLSAGLIIEEGFDLADLKTILKTMEKAGRNAGVSIVTGDTKVVPRGAADGLFINTAGIGIVPEAVDISAANAGPGDKIILSGTMADHGMTILNQREAMMFDAAISSDTAPLNLMVRDMLSVSRNIHVLRDPTRGGVGTTLNEIAAQSGAGIRIYEERLPVKKEVGGLCELLGLDPLYLANEGKLLAIVAAEDADRVMTMIRRNKFGENACIIGEVTAESPGRVIMETRIGGQRIIDMLTGEQLPRIC